METSRFSTFLTSCDKVVSNFNMGPCKTSRRQQNVTQYWYFISALRTQSLYNKKLAKELVTGDTKGPIQTENKTPMLSHGAMNNRTVMLYIIEQLEVVRTYVAGTPFCTNIEPLITAKIEFIYSYKICGHISAFFIKLFGLRVSVINILFCFLRDVTFHGHF